MGLPAALIALSLPSWLSGQAGTDSGGKREMIFIPPV